MNNSHLKIMLELQALQNFTNFQNNSDSTLLFQEFLTNFLAENSFSEAYDPRTQPKTAASSDRVSDKPIAAAGRSLPPAKLPKSSEDRVDFDEIIQKASEVYQLPVKLLKSVIKHESNFNPQAVSFAGASGLMQLMPATAKALGVNNIFDPQENIFGGAKYLRQMLNKYNENIDLALAAYNAGPGNVDKFGGVPPFKETKNYIQKIKNSFLS